MWRLWTVQGNLHDRALPETVLPYSIISDCCLILFWWLLFSKLPLCFSFFQRCSFIYNCSRAPCPHCLLWHNWSTTISVICNHLQPAEVLCWQIKITQWSFSVISLWFPPKGSINKNLSCSGSEVGQNVKLASQTGSLGCGGVIRAFRPVGMFYSRRKVRTALRGSLLMKALQLSGMLSGSCWTASGSEGMGNESVASIGPSGGDGAE